MDLTLFNSYYLILSKQAFAILSMSTFPASFGFGASFIILINSAPSIFLWYALCYRIKKHSHEDLFCFNSRNYFGLCL